MFEQTDLMLNTESMDLSPYNQNVDLDKSI
jgi:hypothetical protein